jgi:hypothetical protein
LAVVAECVQEEAEAEAEEAVEEVVEELDRVVEHKKEAALKEEVLDGEEEDLEECKFNHSSN